MHSAMPQGQFEPQKETTFRLLVQSLAPATHSPCLDLFHPKEPML